LNPTILITKPAASLNPAHDLAQVRPLAGKEVSTTTDLLTEVFATLGGPGWTVYTRYMRNQIQKFLEVRPEIGVWAVAGFKSRQSKLIGTGASRRHSEQRGTHQGVV
jgi:hypothetical protein